MRVLIVEDEPVIALNLELLLEELCHTSLGALTIEEAVKIIALRQFDAAILDVTMPGGDTYAIAATLQEAGIPFAFSTGQPVIIDRFADVPMLEKPYSLEALEQIIAMLSERLSPPTAPSSNGIS